MTVRVARRNTGRFSALRAEIQAWEQAEGYAAVGGWRGPTVVEAERASLFRLLLPHGPAGADPTRHFLLRYRPGVSCVVLLLPFF
jgi:hypothetical protein